MIRPSSLRLSRLLSPNRKPSSPSSSKDHSILGSKLRNLEPGDMKESLLPPVAAEEAIQKGFLAVYVGDAMRRFVIPAVYLSVPDFQILMERAADEFGFQQEGALRIPCDEEDFEEVLIRCLAKTKKNKKKNA
ncbi:hypothetical protein Sjap_023053 [Stephania japonica]|uniref:Small auxin up regulated protein n=1 Tax=Stephania japonica TaxID=461633 RepID=A0AAP0EQJ3_9MAGN